MADAEATAETNGKGKGRKRRQMGPRFLYLVYKVNEDGELDPNETKLLKNPRDIVAALTGADRDPDAKVMELQVPSGR